MKPSVKRSGLEAMRAHRQQRENALVPEVQRWKGEARDAQMRADSERRQRQMFEGMVSSKVGEHVFKMIEEAMAREVRDHIYKALSTVNPLKQSSVEISIPTQMIAFAQFPAEYRIYVDNEATKQLLRWLDHVPGERDDNARRVVKEVLEKNRTLAGHPVEAIYRRVLEEYVAGKRHDGRHLRVSAYEVVEHMQTFVAVDIPALQSRHAIDSMAMRYR